MSKIDKITVNNVDYDIANNDTYSTTEQVIGTWIDGKPLYRKVIHVDSYVVPSNTEITLSTGTDNIDTIITYYGSGKFAGYNQILSIPFIHHLSNYVIEGVYLVNDNEIRIYFGSYMEGQTVTNINIIIEYTKTTDTASQS